MAIQHENHHMQSDWHNLVKRYQTRDNVTGLQQAIDALIDDSGSAFKLLLPDLSDAHILYIGSDTRETASNLAESCASVTALFTSQASFNTQQEKNRLRPGKNNLTLLCLEQMPLTFADACFDGAILDHAHADLSVLLGEAKRVVKPEGWLFLKGDNSLSRETLIARLKALKSNPLTALRSQSGEARSRSGYSRLLTDHGFTPQQFFGLDTLNPIIGRIIELSQPEQIRQFIRQRKLHRLPHWLYRMTVPTLGILASTQVIPKSTLQQIIDRVMTETGADDCQIASMEINRKGKCAVMLDVHAPTPQRLMLKIPLNTHAKHHLAHNQAGLNGMHEAFTSDRNQLEIMEKFPKCVCSGSYGKTPYQVESCVPGQPFSKDRSDQEMSHIVQQAEAILIALQQLPCTHLSLQHALTLPQQIQFIRELISATKPDMLEKFERIANLMLLDAQNAGEARHFFKSDFSVNNTLIEQGRITGIIDLDFWGVSHNRLVDYADFVFSFTRSFYGHSYADGLALINSAKLSTIGPFLNIEKTIAALGGTESEFKQASRIAWINAISHALEFERTRLNSKRLELILFAPINALAACDPISDLK